MRSAELQLLKDFIDGKINPKSATISLTKEIDMTISISFPLSLPLFGHRNDSSYIFSQFHHTKEVYSATISPPRLRIGTTCPVLPVRYYLSAPTGSTCSGY